MLRCESGVVAGPESGQVWISPEQWAIAPLGLIWGECESNTQNAAYTNLSIPFENGVLVIGNVGLGCLQRINSHYKGILN